MAPLTVKQIEEAISETKAPLHARDLKMTALMY